MFRLIFLMKVTGSISGSTSVPPSGQWSVCDQGRPKWRARGKDWWSCANQKQPKLTGYLYQQWGCGGCYGVNFRVFAGPENCFWMVGLWGFHWWMVKCLSMISVPSPTVGLFAEYGKDWTMIQGLVNVPFLGFVSHHLEISVGIHIPSSWVMWKIGTFTNPCNWSLFLAIQTTELSNQIGLGCDVVVKSVGELGYGAPTRLYISSWYHLISK